MSKLVTCDVHGVGPGYVVCLHVIAGAKIAHLEKATEDELGEAVCKACEDNAKEEGRTLDAEDFSLFCAGCLAELRGLHST